MKHLKLTTLQLLLVQLPEDARGIKVFHDIGRPYISYFVGIETFRHYTDEDVELAGKLTELPEEWFEEKIEGTKFHRLHEPYSDHIERESFYSYLQAKEQVYLNGNPYGDKEPEDIPDLGPIAPSVQNKMKDWEDAQARTFDPDRTYIFLFFERYPKAQPN